MIQIEPVQQTNQPILANYISSFPQPVGDVIYFNWTLYNWDLETDPIYVNNGAVNIFGDLIEEYNNDEDWMYNYVASQINVNLIW
jgi:hypothetical protein